MTRNGSAEASITRHLAADHTRLDDLFANARRCVGAGDFTRARAAFKDLTDGLAHHIAIEERFLFPVFDARVGMRGPTTVMEHEHRRIEQLLGSISLALEASAGDSFATGAAELAALLQAHNTKEERILYPRTDAALSEAERAELVAVLQRG
jgi:regulator of cell morphogenesis and NO signaling